MPTKKEVISGREQYAPCVYALLIQYPIGETKVEGAELEGKLNQEAYQRKLMPRGIRFWGRLLVKGHWRWMTKRGAIYTFHINDQSAKNIAVDLLTPKEVDALFPA
jgi:hypothetical protein